MNILPKKRWHVRTKDNIARVRKDEAAAREEERKRQEKLEFAESEARINFLRKKSGLPEVATTITDTAKVSKDDTNDTNQHVDLFSDYKTHIKTTNKDLEKEQKEEREKYEKQIGYLTYLGQDTNEALKLRSWYEIAPKRGQIDDHTPSEKDLKSKQLHDPLTLINALLPPDKANTKAVKRKRAPSPDIERAKEKVLVAKEHVKLSKKPKKEKKHKKGRKLKKYKKDKKYDRKKHEEAEQLKREKLDKLRKERLRREAAERAREEALLKPQEPTSESKETPANVPHTPKIVQKYNSQFNPELAKQNMV